MTGSLRRGPWGPLFDLAGQLGGDLDRLCGAGGDREDLFRALLRQVSDPGTLDVLVIEDVHWADEATVDLIWFLGRRLKSASALLVASYRDEGLTADHPLRVVLGGLAGLRSAHRVTLAPLSPGGVRELSGDSGLDPAELFRLTSGNPFLVTEVLQAGMREVPAAARDAVLARTARLTPQARELLDVAALLGTRIEPGEIEAAVPGSAPLIDEIHASGRGVLASGAGRAGARRGGTRRRRNGRRPLLGPGRGRLLAAPYRGRRGRVRRPCRAGRSR